MPDFHFYRKDLFVVQYFDICNVFIEPCGNIQIDLWDGVELTDDERATIKKFCEELMVQESEYVAAQKKFLKWFREEGKCLDGLTPEEAVEVLERNGF